MAILALVLGFGPARPASCVAGDASSTDSFPVRGLCIAAPSPAQVDRFAAFVRDEFAPRQGNTLILRVDYGFQFTSHPELREGSGLSLEDIRKLVKVCRDAGVRVVPQINLLGHQSWQRSVGKLLRTYPEFDETPWVRMPEKYAWPNPDGLYCKSYCPLHPKVHEVVFALMDEICDAFETDAFHAGLDEVFYLADSQCPRCAGKDRAELFAGEVRVLRDHLALKGRKLWMWGDRLLDGKDTGLGEWEASMNGTARAVDLIPKDVVIFDWHYDRADPTAAYFALKGLSVVTCPWKNPKTAVMQVEDNMELRRRSTPQVRDRVLGLTQTVWSGAERFLSEYDRVSKAGGSDRTSTGEANCFLEAFDAMARMGRPADGDSKAGR